MTLGLSLSAFTLLHVIISLVGIGSGAASGGRSASTSDSAGNGAAGVAEARDAVIDVSVTEIREP